MQRKPRNLVASRFCSTADASCRTSLHFRLVRRVSPQGRHVARFDTSPASCRLAGRAWQSRRSPDGCRRCGPSCWEAGASASRRDWERSFRSVSAILIERKPFLGSYITLVNPEPVKRTVELNGLGILVQGSRRCISESMRSPLIERCDVMRL